MSELKPCPFCGGEVHRVGGDDPRTAHDVECDTCNYIFYDWSVGDVWWNTRPIEDALQAKIDEQAKRIVYMAKELLLFTMESMSEEAYCAGWMSGLENACKDIISGKLMMYGMLHPRSFEIYKERLTRFHSLCCGWWAPDGKFVPDEKEALGE